MEETKINFIALDEGDYDFLADFITENGSNTYKELNYKTPLHWQADFWRGEYSKIFEYNGQKGIIGVKKLSWESKALRKNNLPEVRIKIKYYCVPFVKEVTVQYVEEVLKVLGDIDSEVINGTSSREKIHNIDSDNTNSQSNTSTSAKPSRRDNRGRFSQHRKRTSNNPSDSIKSKSKPGSSKLPAVQPA